MNQNQMPRSPQGAPALSPQRPPQRTPQRQPQRPPQRPPERKQSGVNGVLVGLLIGTVTLLVVSLITLCIVLSVGGLDRRTPNKDDDGGSGNKPQTGQSSGDGQTSNNGQAPTVKIPYTLQLPAVTPSGSVLSSGEGTNPGGAVSSNGAIVVSLKDLSVKASKNADALAHPASMTKVMTLLVACERAKAANDLLTVKEYMLNSAGSGVLVKETGVLDGNDDSFKISPVGKSVTVEDALYLIIYKSDTTACMLLAEYIAGSETAFVELMNQKARDLGLTKTQFVNCTGLTEADGSYNLTTCREMAAMMASALKNPVAKKILTSTAKHNARIYDGTQYTGQYIPFYSDWKNKRLVQNGQDISKTGDVIISGGKTGYEDIPTSCFVTYGVNSKSGEEFVCVTIGKTQNGGSGINNSQSTADTRYLFKTYAK